VQGPLVPAGLLPLLLLALRRPLVPFSRRVARGGHGANARAAAAKAAAAKAAKVAAATAGAAPRGVGKDVRQVGERRLQGLVKAQTLPPAAAAGPLPLLLQWQRRLRVGLRLGLRLGGGGSEAQRVGRRGQAWQRETVGRSSGGHRSGNRHGVAPVAASARKQLLWQRRRRRGLAAPRRALALFVDVCKAGLVVWCAVSSLGVVYASCNGCEAVGVLSLG
jgi:hypothetical protein